MYFLKKHFIYFLKVKFIFIFQKTKVQLYVKKKFNKLDLIKRISSNDLTELCF